MEAEAVEFSRFRFHIPGFNRTNGTQCQSNLCHLYEKYHLKSETRNLDEVGVDGYIKCKTITYKVTNLSNPIVAVR